MVEIFPLLDLYQIELLKQVPTTRGKMNDKSQKGNADIEGARIKMPPELMRRVNNYCSDKNIPVWEFIFDAISEKLAQAYKERRKKPRL